MAYNALRPFVKIRLALHPGDLNRTGFDAVLMRLKQKRQAIAYSSLVSNKIDELSAIEPALATPIYPL